LVYSYFEYIVVAELVHKTQAAVGVAKSGDVYGNDGSYYRDDDSDRMCCKEVKMNCIDDYNNSSYIKKKKFT
jgi:hypothetical protein